MLKNSETAAIGFASAGHTLCHLLVLLFPTVLLALEVEMELSYKELAALAVPAAFLFGAGALPAGRSVIDGAKPICWKYFFTAQEFLRL